MLFVLFLQLCHGAEGAMRSCWASPRVHSGWQGGTDLHSLPGGAGGDGSGSSHGTHCLCPEVHSADTVQRKDTKQQSRWSGSIHWSYYFTLWDSDLTYTLSCGYHLKGQEHHIPSLCLRIWLWEPTLAAADMSCMPRVGKSKSLGNKFD